MTQEMIRVLVVEDHHVVRQGLVALLNVVEGIEVVGEAADGVEAIAQFRKHQPDIALTDLRLPRLSGVEVIQRIRMENPQARFIVLIAILVIARKVILLDFSTATFEQLIGISGIAIAFGLLYWLINLRSPDLSPRRETERSGEADA